MPHIYSPPPHHTRTHTAATAGRGQELQAGSCETDVHIAAANNNHIAFIKRKLVRSLYRLQSTIVKLRLSQLLPPLLLEPVSEGGQHQLDVGRPRVIAHDAHAPHLAGGRPQATCGSMEGQMPEMVRPAEDRIQVVNQLLSQLFTQLLRQLLSQL